MIRKLTGIASSAQEDGILLEVGGVGYHILCAERLRAAIPQGKSATLWIETIIRDETILLFGFENPQQLQTFRLLNKVQGVGQKLALAILSAFPLADLIRALRSKDHLALTAAPGVGARLASRIVNELSEKILNILPAPQNADDLANAEARDLLVQAISALVNLGYPEHAARRAALFAINEQSAQKLDDVIRASLKELA